MTINELIAKIDAHEKEAEAIAYVMQALCIDARGVRKIRTAQKNAEEARAALAVLMGESDTPEAKP